MTRVIVKSGICGFIGTVEVDKVDDKSFKVVITSGCEMVTELGKSLLLSVIYIQPAPFPWLSLRQSRQRLI